MRSIGKRLGKLEGKFGMVETEFTRELAARIEAGRRRVAEWRAHEGHLERTHEGTSGLSVVEILQRGRQRARQA